MSQKLLRFYRRSKLLRSLRPRIFLTIFLAGMIPCLILHAGITSSYESRAVALRTSDVQTQMKVLANHLIYYNYMSSPGRDTINAELDQFSTLNDGRVLVIDDHLRVIKDTYGISEGKTMVSEEIVNCLAKGSEGSAVSYDRTEGYIEVVTPISETAYLEGGDFFSGGSEDELVRGVLLASVSTDSIVQTRNILDRKATLIEIIVLLAIFSLALVLSHVMVQPFNRLTASINDIKEGYSSELVQEPAYWETEHIVGAFNRVLLRMRSLDESREEFVSNVSHELKTPMTSMKVLADSLLQEENVPAEMYREFLLDIDQEIDRENRTISDLLNLVKMDRGTARLSLSTVKMGELVEMLCRRVRPIAQKRDIELTLVSEREVIAEVDEVKITMALSNLIENAVKYNREHGKVEVTLDADHQNFTVTVRDTGVGIPEESLDRIYDRFYRVDKSRSREVGGTGLGLSITKNAILMHRGRIDVTSRLGEGTVFSVTVPLRQGSSGEDRKAQLDKTLTLPSVKEIEKELKRQQEQST
ncbi:sensor histidine kinase [Lachnoclostridium sp. Marseille-P6806]|uniref:sensor histidine kinase n=1 Tax=Lachnoclostridium sp. Marseille-P6806 TaxID=2364793 RepID=UPI00102F7A77|nr:HAMP domain-containing sensor histidine kinase [Lachnoclostridium sp. Marseille-P6806]